MSHGPTTWQEFKAVLEWIATILIVIVVFGVVDYFFVTVLDFKWLGHIFAIVVSWVLFEGKK